ncbi:MAG: ABC transporter substrate-binding protein [Spirochaetes bacterium]|uniref:ABC transporter substrate-binding protein n=1 Tax=Candidatus Ornithospirochaeta stercoripullorum TaxID=2840899 RepID=A0A9D9DX66_9SPIO|nr:ABC transporter substrate-binding protein [Candidatus Ornithospirochaeta stercoripullorum]
MRKAIALLLVAFVCLAGVTAGGAGEGSGDTYKIGFIGPLTGDNANYGIRCSNAARLAIDEINANGGIDGKQLELIAEDSEGTVDKALASYEKLAYMDEVCAIIGPVFTSPALAVAQRCQEDGIVMISPSATHKDVTAQPATNPDGLNYVFRTVPSDALQSEVAGHYFYEVLGYRQLASLYAMNDYSQGLALGMKETFESLGGKVVAEETCMVGDKDFRTQLTQIKAANPEAVYIPNYTVEDAQILEQAAQLGLNVRFLSSDGFSDPEIYNLAPDFTDGVIYVGPAQAEASSLLSDFQAAYAAAYNGDAPDSFATNSYDATYIIAGALDRADSADRTAIRNEVAATKDYQGANGTMNFAANGDLVASQGVYEVDGITPVYVGAFQVVDGHIVQVD